MNGTVDNSRSTVTVESGSIPSMSVALRGRPWGTRGPALKCRSSSTACHWIMGGHTATRYKYHPWVRHKSSGTYKKANLQKHFNKNKLETWTQKIAGKPANTILEITVELFRDPHMQQLADWFGQEFHVWGQLQSHVGREKKTFLFSYQCYKIHQNTLPTCYSHCNSLLAIASWHTKWLNSAIWAMNFPYHPSSIGQSAPERRLTFVESSAV